MVDGVNYNPFTKQYLTAEEIQKLADVVTCHCNDGAVADFIEYLEQKDD